VHGRLHEKEQRAWIALQLKEDRTGERRGEPGRKKKGGTQSFDSGSARRKMPDHARGGSVVLEVINSLREDPGGDRGRAGTDLRSTKTKDRSENKRSASAGVGRGHCKGKESGKRRAPRLARRRKKRRIARVKKRQNEPSDENPGEKQEKELGGSKSLSK